MTVLYLTVARYKRIEMSQIMNRIESDRRTDADEYRSTCLASSAKSFCSVRARSKGQQKHEDFWKAKSTLSGALVFTAVVEMALH